MINEERKFQPSSSDVNIKDSDGMTPPMIAAKNGDSKMIVRILLDAGADIEAKDNKGLNALTKARQLGRSEIVGMLKDAAK